MFAYLINANKRLKSKGIKNFHKVTKFNIGRHLLKKKIQNPINQSELKNKQKCEGQIMVQETNYKNFHIDQYTYHP